MNFSTLLTIERMRFEVTIKVCDMAAGEGKKQVEERTHPSKPGQYLITDNYRL